MMSDQQMDGVSLGSDCQVAYQLRRLGLRTEPGPFDWTITPARSLIHALNRDFRGFLEAGFFGVQAGRPYFVDAEYGVRYIHDALSFETNPDRTRELHRKRVQRFLLRVRHRSPVVLFRKDCSDRDFDELCGAVARFARHSRHVVVGVSDAEVMIAGGPRGTTLRLALPRERAVAWTGDDARWQDVVRAARRVSTRYGFAPEFSDVSRVRELLAKHACDVARMPAVLVRALVAGEDHRYFGHRGLDPVSLLRAIWALARWRMPVGVSTIEQQLWRTMTGRRERSLGRKMRESMGAAMISGAFDKRRLACLYLATAYFGAGMVGAPAACRRMGYHLDGLTEREAARLIACLKYPLPRVPGQDRLKRLELRADYVAA
jgi:hypothetical protein